jgi:hypothetical protein
LEPLKNPANLTQEKLEEKMRIAEKNREQVSDNKNNINNK